ncbi:MAG: hypothetical protein P8X89_17625 [Reinekea sp.]
MTAFERQELAQKEPWYRAKRNLDDAINLIALAEKESSLTSQLEGKATRSNNPELFFVKNCRFTPIFGKQRGINGLRTAPLWSHGFRSK